MITQKLHDNWHMRRVGDADFINAAVPGSVYQDLLTAGKMEDPFFKDNEFKALELMDYDYEYETTFTVSEKLLASKHVFLHSDGLDTIADLYLNGGHFAYVDNQHRTWEWELTGKVKPGENTLKIVFHSPNKYIKEAYAKTQVEGSGDSMRGFPLIRKAACMFGWDWGPHLPDAGIWRALYLIGSGEERIDDVHVFQHHTTDASGKTDVVLTVNIKADIYASGKDARSVIVTVTDDAGKEVAKAPAVFKKRKTRTDAEGSEQIGEKFTAELTVKNAALWWPRGYGEQNFYHVNVKLSDGVHESDERSLRIGLRTMELHRQKDEWGESFSHRVNGVDIFAMGADYIPEDNLLGRVTPDVTRKLLNDAAAANMNTIRVWGGGHYPSDVFYDTCDELGLLVWEDFMFACAVYDLSPAFEASIRAEFEDNIKRIRSHPSLAVWCGNNEMEMFAESGRWPIKGKLLSDYFHMYEYILPKLIAKYDPQNPYWPASPSSGGGFDDPNAENRGDVHYWTVWHGNAPFSDYRKYFFRYVSEFGFQSFPLSKTVDSITDDERDKNIFSYVMEKHQRNHAANGKIMNYMYRTFLYPSGFDNVLYASHLLQMEAIKYGAEHFRQYRGRCMGVIYWQLNDCWPVASWASIDYSGRWKALHYSAKRFFAPILLSCEEEGLLTQDDNINAEPHVTEKSIKLNVANETRQDQTVTVAWALRDAHGRKIEDKKQDATTSVSGQETLTAPALSSVWLDKHDFPNADLHSDYVSYECSLDGKVISEGTVIFSLPKFFKWVDPQLAYTVSGDEITVTASAYARSVEILNENEDLVLSDNYFDLNANSKTVKVLRGKPEGIKLRSVYDIK